MRENVKFFMSLSTSQVIRIRERGLLERFDGKKFVLESLSNGAFRTKGQYFETEKAAQDALNKVYCLDILQQKKNKAITKIKTNFEESIKGTYEYDFYQFLDNLIINDYIIRHDDWSTAVCSSTSNGLTRDQKQFLLKYNYPTNLKGYEIENQEGEYAFWLKTYTEDKVIFWTVPFSEKENGENYKYLFESKLHLTYSKYI